MKKGCCFEGSQLVINASIGVLILLVGFSARPMQLVQNLSRLFGAIRSPQESYYENVDLSSSLKLQAGRLSGLTPSQSRVQHFVPLV